MNRSGRAAVILVTGTVALWLIATGEYAWFVQQRMRWPLMLGGAVAVLLGLTELIVSDRRNRAEVLSAKTQAAPVVGWLMMLPVVVLMAVAPTALGSTAAERARGFIPEREQQQYPDLPDSDSPISMRVYDFVDQAVWDPEQGLRDREIALEGFVVHDERYPNGFMLVRFAVSCCAADGLPLRVAFPNADVRLAVDSWITAVVVWRPPPDGTYFNVEGVPFAVEGDLIIEADLVSHWVMPEPPAAPYESPGSDK